MEGSSTSRIPTTTAARAQSRVRLERTQAVDSVQMDNFQGACSAVEYLLEQKPKSLLLLTGPACIPDSQERLRGAQQAIRNAPYEMDITILEGNFYQEEGRRVFAEHIRKLPEAKRSQHPPFHSIAAIGKHAQKLADAVGHTSFDRTSVFGKMYDLDFKVCMFGTSCIE